MERQRGSGETEEGTGGQWVDGLQWGELGDDYLVDDVLFWRLMWISSDESSMVGVLSDGLSWLL